jgi:hypothetical protein
MSITIPVRQAADLAALPPVESCILAVARELRERLNRPVCPHEIARATGKTIAGVRGALHRLRTKGIAVAYTSATDPAIRNLKPSQHQTLDAARALHARLGRPIRVCDLAVELGREPDATGRSVRVLRQCGVWDIPLDSTPGPPRRSSRPARTPAGATRPPGLETTSGRLMEAGRRLSGPDCRRVSIAEIAREVGISNRAASVHIHRMRRRGTWDILLVARNGAEKERDRPWTDAELAAGKLAEGILAVRLDGLAEMAGRPVDAAELADSGAPPREGCRPWRAPADGRADGRIDGR